jgi:hypothetical protein
MEARQIKDKTSEHTILFGEQKTDKKSYARFPKVKQSFSCSSFFGSTVCSVN